MSLGDVQHSLRQEFSKGISAVGVGADIVRSFKAFHNFMSCSVLLGTAELGGNS